MTTVQFFDFLLGVWVSLVFGGGIFLLILMKAWGIK